MGLFFPKKISSHDFQHGVRAELLNRGLTRREVDRVSEIADASLNESGNQRGIDRREKDQLVRLLKEHRMRDHFSKDDIKAIDETLSEGF
jgi:hypothetical protein